MGAGGSTAPTSCRIEEALELTQLSIRKYLRPNGETIGLLVIAPSKTEREWVIPISAELFAVIAAIIRRHHDTLGTIPPCHAMTRTKRSIPRRCRSCSSAATAPPVKSSASTMSPTCCGVPAKQLAIAHPQFSQARFTPHDFRRLFATDAVNNGLPIHIGAALLGHMNLETTRGYVAVFEEDLIRHYQAFLERRRQLRPQEEYRPTTDAEWQEFQEL